MGLLSTIHRKCCAILLGVFACVFSAHAQGNTKETKQKDVVILVDVSASVDSQAAKEALQVVADLIQGRYLQESTKESLHRSWQLQPNPKKVIPYFEIPQATEDFNYLTKSEYLHNLFTGKSSIDPLTARSQTIQLLFFGDRQRIRNSKKQRNPFTVVDLQSTLNSITRQMQQFGNFRDQHTHLRLAIAQARKFHGQDSQFYLFVISDAQDDPVELTAEDQRLIADWGPDSEIAQEDHPFVVLEKKGGETIANKTKPYICGVAVGFDPAEVIEPKIEPVDYEGYVRLLGGLADGSQKAFIDQDPFIAWQVERLPEKELLGEYRYLVSIRDQEAPDLLLYGMNLSAYGVSRLSLENKNLYNDRKGKQARGFELPPGNWTITVEEADNRLKPATAYIEVTRKKRFPYLFSIVAGSGSLLLFAYSWWAARRRTS